MAQRAGTLEEYLSEGYAKDMEDIRAIESTLAAIAKTYVTAFDHRLGYWPLAISAESGVGEPRRSHGTSAMILSALGKISDKCILRNDINPYKIRALPANLNSTFEKGLTALFDQLRSDKKCRSGTFGENDPLTISHVAALMHALRGAEAKVRAKAALKSISTAVSRIATLSRKDPGDEKSFTAALREGAKVIWSPRNAFLALRVVRAQVDLKNKSTVISERYKRFFEAHIHQQLSFSSIPDSRFDPAELAFCLEGLLICAEEAVDPLLFGRVLSVLRANQETSAYWRPNRPFADRPTGEIMLPLSVEGANSLLHATEMLDKAKLHDTFAGEAVPMFRRFWQWLRARQVEFSVGGVRCVGWHSEHINDPGVIHLWDTSQVVEFLLAFRTMLQRHIARETLVLAGVKVEEPKEALWPALTTLYEPISRGSTIKSARVFDRVKNDFIRPWMRLSTDRNYSMLIYGPPGTGKTTLAQSIAHALSLRLITVTVSDFLGEGGALVEARAKAIFQMLESQTHCVVFFDELDAFLLDRDSIHYQQQDTLFKFLTPGMLTKINGLRAQERVIFIIATNYENRIDPAIKRTGRIDQQYLLLPPDLKKRHAILRDLKASEDKNELIRMARASVYLSYNDIRAVVHSGGSANTIIEKLKRSPRSSSYETYLKRLKLETTFPYTEFAAAVEMAHEAGQLSQVKVTLSALNADDRKKWQDIIIHASPPFNKWLTKMRLANHA